MARKPLRGPDPRPKQGSTPELENIKARGLRQLRAFAGKGERAKAQRTGRSDLDAEIAAIADGHRAMAAKEHAKADKIAGGGKRFADPATGLVPAPKFNPFAGRGKPAPAAPAVSERAQRLRAFAQRSNARAQAARDLGNEEQAKMHEAEAAMHTRTADREEREGRPEGGKWGNLKPDPALAAKQKQDTESARKNVAEHSPVADKAQNAGEQARIADKPENHEKASEAYLDAAKDARGRGWNKQADAHDQRAAEHGARAKELGGRNPREDQLADQTWKAQHPGEAGAGASAAVAKLKAFRARGAAQPAARPLGTVRPSTPGAARAAMQTGKRGGVFILMPGGGRRYIKQ